MPSLSALTAEQLSILRSSRDEVKPPPAALQASSFWADVDLLVYFGLLAMRAGRLGATPRGREYLDSLRVVLNSSGHAMLDSDGQRPEDRVDQPS